MLRIQKSSGRPFRKSSFLPGNTVPDQIKTIIDEEFKKDEKSNQIKQQTSNKVDKKRKFYSERYDSEGEVVILKAGCSLSLLT